MRRISEALAYCIHTRPYVTAWVDAFKDEGLVVVGVHTPEFAYEKNIDNVRQAADGFNIRYPSPSTMTTASGGRSRTATGRPSA